MPCSDVAMFSPIFILDLGPSFQKAPLFRTKTTKTSEIIEKVKEKVKEAAKEESDRVSTAST